MYIYIYIYIFSSRHSSHEENSRKEYSENRYPSPFPNNNPPSSLPHADDTHPAQPLPTSPRYEEAGSSPYVVHGRGHQAGQGGLHRVQHDFPRARHSDSDILAEDFFNSREEVSDIDNNNNSGKFHPSDNVWQGDKTTNDAPVGGDLTDNDHGDQPDHDETHIIAELGKHRTTYDDEGDDEAVKVQVHHGGDSEATLHRLPDEGSQPKGKNHQPETKN